LKIYPPNSPEAMARILAMMIVTDAHIDDREIAILDRLDAYAILGLSRNEFMRVAQDYCTQLVQEAEEHGETPILDADRADAVIDCVDVPSRRIVVARLLLAVLAADQQQRESELVLYGHILDRWNISRDEVAKTMEMAK
jgi:predicted polyphosphate/ATP-dependent NAD kinase